MVSGPPADAAQAEADAASRAADAAQATWTAATGLREDEAGKWRGQGKWRDPRSFRRAKSRSAVNRNAADRNGTMAPADRSTWLFFLKGV